MSNVVPFRPPPKPPETFEQLRDRLLRALGLDFAVPEKRK
jgi:hypothetical protein